MVWFVASIFYAYQYILRVMPNIMLPDIMEQFNIGAATFGQFSGVYYLGYSLLHLPIGIMLDRFGPRKVMSGCILLTVVGLSPLLFSDYWVYPILGRLVIGIGSSAAILGLFKIIRMTFSEAKFARMLSFSVTIGLMGAIYGGGPVSFMRDLFGYQPVVQMIAVGGIALALLTYLIVPEMEGVPSKSVMSDLKEVIKNKKMLACCFLAGMMVGPLEGFADVWGTVFLREVYGIEPIVAASLPSTIFIGMCFGAPVLSLVAEKTGNTLGTIAASGFMMTMAFILLLFTSPPVSVVTVLFALIGVASAYQILAIYKASTYVREEVAGVTTAIANMIIMIFGYVFHTAMGMTINAFGGPTAPVALIYGVTVIPVSLAIATFGYMVLLKQDQRVLQPE